MAASGGCRGWAPAAAATLLLLCCLPQPAAAEEEAQVSAVNVGISVMLLGSIAFMMALFELTHCYKRTMAKYTWKAISATISIFSAVLIFQGVNGLVEAYILEGATQEYKLLVSIAHMLLWFASLQWMLAIITGVLPLPGLDVHKDGLDCMENRLKTFAILLGHITGFAAINAFATFQQVVPKIPIATFAVAPIGWAAIYLLGRLTDMVRERVALIGDGVKERHEEMWDEVAEETEDDVVGLAVSFVFVQSVRFVVGGTLPNAEGEEPESAMLRHTDVQAAKLLAIGGLLAVVETLRVIFIKAHIKRLTPQLKNIVAMTFSWCLFFGVDWLLTVNLFQTEHGMMKQVTLALNVTVFALMMLFLLEHVHGFKVGLRHVDDTVDQAIRVIVNAIGILIGFAWEKAFDVAVAEVTETVSILPPAWTKLFLAIGLAGMVVPAWYRHILPTIMAIEEEENEEGCESNGKGSSPGNGKSKLATPIQDGTLRRPLLRGASGGRQRGGGDGGDDAAMCRELQARLEELEPAAARAHVLEGQNAELQEAIVRISKELEEIQGMASLL